MSGPRIDTSHIKSPHDPMKPEEREAVRAELREGLAEVERYIAEHGDPWEGMRPDWARSNEADLDNDAAWHLRPSHPARAEILSIHRAASVRLR